LPVESPPAVKDDDDDDKSGAPDHDAEHESPPAVKDNDDAKFGAFAHDADNRSIVKEDDDLVEDEEATDDTGSL
jgi:hypothetical protein